ncbi:MAG: metallophosphoesterase [Dissulfurispiraceae bacterium]
MKNSKDSKDDYLNSVLDGCGIKGITRRDFIKYSAATVAGTYLAGMSACGGGGGGSSNSTFPVLVFSDVHFDPLYDQTLYPLLNSSDPSQWASIFQTSTITTPPTWGNDTNYPLLKLALANISQNLGSCPLVIYTGDILGHNIPNRFFSLYGSSGVAATAALEAFTDKAVSFFTSQVRAALGNVPVLFAVGNLDSYTGWGPDSAFLSSNAGNFYTNFLNGITDQPTFNSTFTAGGYYTCRPLGKNLVVIGINTILLANGVPVDNSAAVATEIAWLDSQLAAAQAAGQQVWLLMHVPPGAVVAATVANGLPVTATSASMMLVPNYQSNLMTTLQKYPGLISLTLGAHTHMDEYRIMSPTNNVLEITPSIAPFFGNNPAFKIFTISSSTYQPVDYVSINYDLATLPSQFNSYYTFSASYAMQGSLNTSLTNLYPLLKTNSAQQSLYQGYYFSGNNYSAPAAITESLPITDANWPVFWSSIDNMDVTALISGINTY